MVAEIDSNEDIFIMQLHHAVEARHFGITITTGIRTVFIQEVEVYLQSKLYLKIIIYIKQFRKSHLIIVFNKTYNVLELKYLSSIPYFL